MYKARWLLLGTVGIGIFYTFIFMKFMDKCALQCAWISVIAVQLGLIGGGFLFWFARNDYIYHNGINTQAKSTENWLLGLAMLFWVLGSLYAICLCCNLKSLQVSIRIIETAADFFADTKRVALVPLFFLVVSIVTLFGFVYGYICVSSIGNITVSNIALQTKSIEHTDNKVVLAQWALIFGCLWTIAFLLSCNEFVIVVSAATWYFSNKQIPDDDGIPGDAEVYKGFLWIPLYHFGSLAIGSLTITLVWIIRGAFEYAANHIQSNSSETGCLLNCIRCCLSCFDKFMRYLTKNAYIYMALSSESFCTSALNAFILMLKNAAKFAFVEGFSDFFMFIAKLSISIFTTATGIVILSFTQKD